ncbi:MAG: CopG family transcriptional regulator [Haloferacaceae archaeon]
MAADEVEDLPDDLREWVDRRADERGVDAGDVVRRVLAAHRAVERRDGGATPGGGDDGVDPVTDRLDRLADRVDDLEADADATQTDRVDDLEARVESLSDDLDEMITDVRERVVQVKRETDAKAPADHDHDDLRESAERARRTAADLETRVEAVEDRLDDGFADFREVVEGLADETDDLAARTERLARVAVDLRERVDDLEAQRNAREAVDELRRTANRRGETTAACEACGRTVRLGLLARPRCPHCDAAFEDLDPSSGFFGSATLRTGTPPALTGESEAVDSPADLFETGDDR